ncbi:MAG: trypsin-like peptidase domain-containing protein [Myxococcota bacterium]|jgi:serine protease Do|nr:trypsin-like peptidase domain-containing protein [Myxococcota bacterium]
MNRKTHRAKKIAPADAPLAAIILAITLATTAGAATRGDDEANQTAPPFWTKLETPRFIEPVGVPNTFADLAEQVSPAVVNIQVSVGDTESTGIPRRWREYHDFPFEFTPHGPARGEGSGFVISPSGYVVTNAHVIEGAEKITVSFLDGRKLTATVVGTDPKTDIALIKVESETPLQAIPLGDSDSVRPGEWVVAIGNAMSLAHSVTAGIVSAKHRYLARGNYDDFIQTDAAINPGNSGGPLINLAGEVIGINTAINPAANTIGFAVPIKIAKQILPQLKADGRVTRSWLGVEIHELTSEEKQRSGADRGALVFRVLPETPAMRAGLEAGDVIVAFDGSTVESHRQLPVIVANTSSNREVEVEVLRKGERRAIGVTLAQMEEAEPRGRTHERFVPPPPLTAPSSSERFGLDVQELDAPLAEQLGLENADGVIVTHVEVDSPAGHAGLRRGDVVLEVEGERVDSTAALDQALADAGDRAVLLVRRDGATLFIPLRQAP